MSNSNKSDLSTEALKKFRVIFNSIKTHFQHIEEDCQISGAQLWALSKIHETPGVRVSDLAVALSIHQSTASNLVEQLVTKKMVTRKRGPIDHRIVRLYATPEANTIIQRAPKPFKGVLPDALEKLPETSLVALNQHLSELIKALDSSNDDAANTPLSDM
jgi:DNA-binding MarR family transcriptional regulator